jgi:hypothetical protein
MVWRVSLVAAWEDYDIISHEVSIECGTSPAVGVRPVYNSNGFDALFFALESRKTGFDCLLP